jgi:release factor glutamine methyltransferase
VADGSLQALVRAASARLAREGVASPLIDATALVAHASSLDASEVRVRMARGDAVPDTLEPAVLESALARRAAREPLQHILGAAPFRGLLLEVGPGVFVPRPETEVVAGCAIEAALALAARGADPLVADLCAGSGAIGISIAAEVPSARVSLVELDAAAYAYLERNVSAQEPSVRARLVPTRGDARTALASADATLHVVVANPPYIPPAATPRDPEVADHDPAVALYGLGADGLEVPRGIAAAAARLLRPGGAFVMEHGDEQGAEVRAALASTKDWAGIETGTDHSGRDRFVVATRA